MNSKIDDWLKRTVNQLAEALSPEEIHLFGSHARGDANEDSDVDLMVVVGQSDEPRYRRAWTAYRAATDHSQPTDILVWTRDEWNRGLAQVVSLPATILREGRRLYRHE